MSDPKSYTEEDRRDIISAIHGAIGWIAGTTNEGNHDIGKYTREQLTRAAQIVRGVKLGDAE